jgi:myo-inositol-hexaphosphate 3-phosphohydrolase
MTTFNWTVAQMDRKTADGFVVAVHYRCDATGGEYTASTYGTVSYTQEPEVTYVPYAELTEATVVGWVQESLGKDTVEASLASQIAAQKNTVQATGLPWAAAE